MKAIIYRKKNKIEPAILPEPELEKNGAIIKVTGCGLCGSDIVKIRQGLIKEGTVTGHEVVGHISKIKGNKSFNPGDRIVLGHHVPCFRCVFCKNENYSMCAHFKQSNIIPGGFAEYIYVSEEHLKHTVFKVPDNVPDIDASFTEPTACCLRAVKRAGIKPGDNVLIIGLGSIGLVMGQIVKHFGANAYGTELIDERKELANCLGIETVVSKGYDKVFLTAGSDATINAALSSVRDGGTIVVFAGVPSGETSFPNNEIYYRELTVMGSYSPSPADLGESLGLISKKVIKVGNLSSVYDIEDIEKAIDDTVSNKIIKAFIRMSP